MPGRSSRNGTGPDGSGGGNARELPIVSPIGLSLRDFGAFGFGGLGANLLSPALRARWIRPMATPRLTPVVRSIWVSVAPAAHN
jgi:hypothetical protein